MAWILLTLVLVACIVALVVAVRRREVEHARTTIAERREAAATGSAQARLQYPVIDLSRCIGCGSCVAACPEEGVLGMLHGQAVVLHGSRCVGHARCAEECPVGAVAVTLGDLTERRDIPALASDFESPHVPGLFLAGEVTGHALVRTAIAHGTAVAATVAARVQQRPTTDTSLDLCIVGAGPAGLACSLEAKRRGLRFVTLEREGVGGAVSQYPRRKLVMTQPVDLPLHGRLTRSSYSKEELMELWEGIAEREELPIVSGRHFDRVEQRGDGTLRVLARVGPSLDAPIETYDARHVCLALGRRGTPRKLDVPGEDLPKVAYSLLDAQSYVDRRILVVGGGDSAVEAALGLAEQSGNRVTLSYRRNAFARIKSRNARRIAAALEEDALEVLFESQVETVADGQVELTLREGGVPRRLILQNDEVFVFAGGTPPFEQLERSGVSFDHSDRPPDEPLVEQGAGLVPGLAAATLLGLVVLAWALLQQDYYGAEAARRVALDQHGWLRPAAGLGLWLGIAAALLILTNLAYLVRRSPRLPIRFGTLRGWMTSHLVTGLMAFLLTVLHAGFAPRHTVGGHALWALAILVTTGAIGRYFYAFVPRAANGRELAIDEARTELARLTATWEGDHRAFAERARATVDALVDAEAWRGSFLRRVRSLVASQFGLGKVLARIALDGRAEGIPAGELRELLQLARRAHRTALMVAHYEDLRALLATWRYLHRWVALLMVLLVVAHIVTALEYADLGFGGAP
ncbi:Ferredoxin--NADP reductase [Planctomycetes bacterium Pla163]|uniref:Ferredoxin--NADP reductase n=1 Tax=Rohdeia mirabilis TaxID=2528008 RepID=A0A518CVQ2_9BACT|nr:Ferredoxin--NADP reductase [Planctomycetes bacterium Pla163]